MTVQQSGNVTRGHLASWVTDGVIGDAGPNPYSERVIASLLNADFNTTSDQILTLATYLKSFMLTRVIVTNSPTSLNVAVGGLYTAASKGGQAIVAASQAYSALTGAQGLLNATLTTYAQNNQFNRTNVPSWNFYLSLTTAQGATAPAAVYIVGIELS